MDGIANEEIRCNEHNVQLQSRVDSESTEFHNVTLISFKKIKKYDPDTTYTHKHAPKGDTLVSQYFMEMSE